MGSRTSAQMVTSESTRASTVSVTKPSVLFSTGTTPSSVRPRSTAWTTSRIEASPETAACAPSWRLAAR